MGKHYFEENLTPEHPGMALHTSYNNMDYQSIKDVAETGQIIEKDGLYGLKDEYGNMVYECVFDQIEKGRGWVYTRQGLDYTIINENRTESYFHQEEDFFVEDGKMGWQKDGKIIVPAIYDYVAKPWDRYDLFNVEDDGICKCINSKGEEILKSLKDYKGNNEIYFSSNDREDVITQCMLEREVDGDSTVVFKDGQKVKLVKTCCRDIAGRFLLGDAELPITNQALRRFNNEFSYEFSSYMANSFDRYQPIRECFWKLEQFDFDCNSWFYIVKVEMHPSVEPSTVDMNYLRTYFDKIDKVLGTPVIGFGFNPDLREGETRVHLVTFYNEVCFPPGFYWEWQDNSREMALEQIKEAIPNLKQTILENVESEDQQSMWHDMMDDVITFMRYSEERSWEETEKVLDFFKESGANYRHGLLRAALNAVEEKEYRFYLQLMKWMVRNGAEINESKQGKTALDMIIAEKEDTEKRLETERDPETCAELAKKLAAFTEMTKFLESHGALTKVQIDKECEEYRYYKLILPYFSCFDEDGWPCPDELE